jgi:predicted lipid-binding transport protein (Tim44 family)
MKIWSAILALTLTATLGLSGGEAEAKRFGGGSSVGKQSSNVTQRQASPAGGSAAQAARPAAPAAAAAAPKKPWGAMLGGLAAGLGLAWLASSLGLGAGLAQFMTFALLALAVMLVIGFVMRKLKSNREGQGSSASPFAFQGAGATPVRDYSPANVGNDASARPWERPGALFESTSAPAPTTAAGGSMIGSALLGSQSWGVPAGFDADGFLAACKTNFVTLQDAWDRSDISSLRAMMTDDMLAQIKSQLAERESHTGGVFNKTDVLRLDAQLLGIEELADV